MDLEDSGAASGLVAVTILLPNLTLVEFACTPRTLQQNNLSEWTGPASAKNQDAKTGREECLTNQVNGRVHWIGCKHGLCLVPLVDEI